MCEKNMKSEVRRLHKLLSRYEMQAVKQQDAEYISYPYIIFSVETENHPRETADYGCSSKN